MSSDLRKALMFTVLIATLVTIISIHKFIFHMLQLCSFKLFLPVDFSSKVTFPTLCKVFYETIIVNKKTFIACKLKCNDQLVLENFKLQLGIGD